MSDYRLTWESGVAAWAETARFFAQVISQDTAYISHGEIQTGLSLDGRSWIPDLEQRFLDEAISDDTCRSLAVARDAAGMIVGAAAVSWDFETVDAPFATLQDLAIAPSLRSHGLGAEIVTLVEAEAKARGAKWLFLESGKNNHRAHEFFARSGFDEISHVFVKRMAD